MRTNKMEHNEFKFYKKPCVWTSLTQNIVTIWLARFPVDAVR